MGLALLLRESECRFIDDGSLITDPGSDEAERILTTESRFRNVRVQGVRSQLTPPELRDIRDSHAPDVRHPQQRRHRRAHAQRSLWARS